MMKILDLKLTKAYYKLTKPGIIRGNAVTATAGFLLGADGRFMLASYLWMLIGLSLIIASACVFNNYIDRDIDKKMARTKKRGFVTGEVSVKGALVYGTILGFLGTISLFYFANRLALGIALGGFFIYVVLYGLAKRRSVHGTIVGSFAGAAPILTGYVAATNHFDGAGLILFLILVLWQMPHFYAIAIYRQDDYAAANLPVLPVKTSVENAKVQIILYTAFFTISAMSLSLLGFAGKTYLFVASILGISWLVRGVRGLNAPDTRVWARKMFVHSLIIITVLCLAISLNSVLP
ncbi:MAG TPA: heme o synthase [Patescibacteria group bacterium]|nr:heme o synthase [Patescibacteria group bacterium]